MIFIHVSGPILCFLGGAGQAVPWEPCLPTTSHPYAFLSKSTCVPRHTLPMHPSPTFKGPPHHPYSLVRTTCTLFYQQHWSVHAAGNTAVVATMSATTVHTTHMPYPKGTGILGAWVVEHFKQTDWGKVYRQVAGEVFGVGISSSGPHQKP